MFHYENPTSILSEGIQIGFDAGNFIYGTNILPSDQTRDFDAGNFTQEVNSDETENLDTVNILPSTDLYYRLDGM